MDISHLKVVDDYTGRIVKVSTTEALCDWLLDNTRTHTDNHLRQVVELGRVLEAHEDYKWHGKALGLTITEIKKKRKRY